MLNVASNMRCLRRGSGLAVEVERGQPELATAQHLRIPLARRIFDIFDAPLAADP